MSLQVVQNFAIIDETDDWVVVDKPAPLIVHPANNKPEPTLLGGLEHYFAYEIANGAKMGIVTRLDRETSGLVLVAKTTKAARGLGIVFERREARKEYLAIVIGWPEANEWTNDSRICRAGDVRETDIWVRQIVDPAGKECRTSFFVENRFERNGSKFSLVRCFPKTGRMHQIRVHLAASGFPIVGDKIYSGDGHEYLQWMQFGWSDLLAEKLLLSRHALHASRLSLDWDGIEVAWQAPLPNDLRDFIEGRHSKPSPDIVIWNHKG
ncbi:MAG: RluA family pseudouridine synthase [Akkermansiaceae bacterium]